MHPFLDYILKANLLLIFFGVFYLIFLKRETFYQLNRWYFIGSIIVSITAPLITFTKTVLVDPIPVEFYVNDSENVIINEVVEEPSFLETIDLQEIAVYLILFISSILIIRKIYAVAKLYHSIKKLPSLGASNIKITADNKTVYSFFQWIVVPENFFQWQNHKMILDHESIHLNQKHTFDLILIELVAAVFWFNPLVKVMQRAINTNLEFIVDQKMIETTESVLYQKNLLQFQTQQAIQFVNSYNASEIKNRILQLNSKKSTNMKKLKFLLATPALVAFFALFQIETVAQVKETIEVQEVFENDEVEDSFYVMIHSKYDDEYYEKTEKMLREKYNLNVTINNLKRNKDGELTSIKISCKDDTQYFLNEHKTNTKPFSPFQLYVYKNDNGKYYIETVSEEANILQKIVVGSYDNKKNNDTLSFDEDLLRTNRKIFNDVAQKFPIIIDDVLMTKKQLKKFDNTKIKSMTLAFNNIVKNTPTIVLSTTNEITTKELILKKSAINEIKIKGKTANFEELKDHIKTENTKKEPLRLKTSVYDYATGTVIRPFSPSQYSTVEESYTIYQNGETPNTKRTVYKDASGKILKVEDSDDVQLASNRFVTSNVVYVIDGDIVMEDNFRKIEPKDIESITILKDQKSKEKYAATNKEGVMLITTKSKKQVSLQQKTQALKARELAMRQRNEAITERNEVIQNRKEREKSRQQLLKKRNEISEKAQQRRKELEEQREKLLAKRKETIVVSNKKSDKKLLNDDYKTLTDIFNDVNKTVKDVEDENFKITSVRASITREDGTKVELAEVY